MNESGFGDPVTTWLWYAIPKLSNMKPEQYLNVDHQNLTKDELEVAEIIINQHFAGSGKQFRLKFVGKTSDMRQIWVCCSSQKLVNCSV